MKKRVITMMLACAVCSGQAQEKLRKGKEDLPTSLVFKIAIK